MATKAHRRDFLSELMDEHIEMPGCPSLIVTRAEAWSFLASLGYQETETPENRFGTVAYMVMNPRKRALDLPLSDESTKQRVFAAMRADVA